MSQGFLDPRTFDDPKAVSDCKDLVAHIQDRPKWQKKEPKTKSSKEVSPPRLAGALEIKEEIARLVEANPSLNMRDLRERLEEEVPRNTFYKLHEQTCWRTERSQTRSQTRPEG
mmetsp:Transcript_37826/g.89508  ORF Transcript_37826/g.89508 Transcript_37826/m.89508 type:complete len:114 (+) Transcript_37826:316-657(+)